MTVAINTMEEKEKSKIRHKRYSIANKDEIAEKAAIRYRKNKAKRQAYLREYYQLNKDHLQTKAREYVR